jgi:hypothetical protein
MEKVKPLISSVLSHKNTPIVLTAVSCGGVVLTAFLSGNAAINATRILEELREKEYYDGVDYTPIPFKVAAKHTWTAYLPAVSTGILTLGSIIAMNQVSSRNIALITAGATLATSTLKEYSRNVLEEVGAERESKIRDKMAKNVKLTPVPGDQHDVLFIGDDEVTFYDPLSGRYFKSTNEDIRAVENRLNKELLSTMYMPLNSFYYELGLEPVDLGDIVGFNVDNMIDLHFSTQFDPKKRPVVVLQHINTPAANFYEQYSHGQA